MDTVDNGYFLKTKNYGFRLYEHDRDEGDVCKLCWNNALPGGRPFPLMPESRAMSFGRIITGPFAKYANEYFYVADDLATGKLVGYLTGAEGSAVKTEKGKIPWMQWRDQTAMRIAENEFGEISFKIYMPTYGYIAGSKILNTLSMGPRAIQFLLHAKFYSAKEMPKAPVCPEYHFHVATDHRGRGIGNRLIEHFVSQFGAKKYKHICAQVTVCEGQKSLEYYKNMTYRDKKVWKVYDKKETAMYTASEKRAWDLGSVVENVCLVADKKRLLAFVKQRP